jgi:hypothetical protein
MFEPLQGAQSGDNDDDTGVVEKEEAPVEGGEEGGEPVAAPAQVWDEEDEIEAYFREKSEDGRGDEESDSDSGSESDEDYAGGTAAMLGDNPTLDDLNAETQRILRGMYLAFTLDFILHFKFQILKNGSCFIFQIFSFAETAARDRLGKGQKIEIKPLTGIVAKLKERRALAIARAPKPRLVNALPNFDDILAEATAKDDATAAATATAEEVEGASTPKRATSPAPEAADGDNNNTENPFAGLAAAAAAAKGIEKFLSTPKVVKEFEEEDELDLEVVSEDEDDGGQAFKVVELPSTRHKEPKPSPLIFNPYNETQDVDEFEDEPLIDDGLNDDDSDSESERSWEIRKDGEEEGEPEVKGHEKKLKKKDKGSAAGGVGAEEDDGSSGDDEAESDDDDDDDDDEDAEEEEDGEDLEREKGGSPAEDGSKEENNDGLAENGLAKPAPLSTAAIMIAAANAIPDDKTKRMQRKFLDTEAELSDEDGAAAAVSDDEEEDDLNDNGELADLITSEKMKTKDLRATEEYHNQWARQHDAKELQQVLRGLENGFRRNRFGGLDDANDEIHGRLRRARFDGDDFEGVSGAFAFPSAFGAGNGGQDEEEECEDEAMLNRARRQKILAGSQNAVISPGAIPLDDESQGILGLMARSASESQGGAGAGGWMACHAAPPSRLALELRGLNSDKSLKRGPSFVGRQSTVVRTTNGSGMGLGSGRSFVFGRSENSNSAMAPEGGMPGSQQQQQQQGMAAGGTQEDAGIGGAVPVSFANLRQLAGLPGSASGSGGSAAADGAGGGAGKGKKKRKAGSTLVSRLKTSGSMSLHESQESLNAVSAVCMNIAQGPIKKRR